MSLDTVALVELVQKRPQLAGSDWSCLVLSQLGHAFTDEDDPPVSETADRFKVSHAEQQVNLLVNRPHATTVASVQSI